MYVPTLPSPFHGEGDLVGRVNLSYAGVLTSRSVRIPRGKSSAG
jgi:hypothetical protein